MGWRVISLEKLRRQPGYRFDNGTIYTNNHVYIRAGGSSVRVLRKMVSGERCFSCGFPIDGPAIVVECRELYERRPLGGKYRRGEYVWIESKLYYHPSCYYDTPRGTRSLLDFMRF